MLFQGGLIGGALGLLLFCLTTGAPFWRLSDLAAPAVALAQAVGWVGALLHGASYGRVLASPLSLWLPDLYGIHATRFPTQLLAALLGLCLFLLLHRLGRRRLLPGVVALLYLMLNGMGHLLLGFSRADEAAYVGRIRVTQAMDLTVAAAATALLLFLWQCYRARCVRG